MQWFVTVVVIAALGLAAVAAAGGLGEMRKQPVRDMFHQDLPPDRPLTAAEIDGIRFAVTVRGYSMAQVDALLDRLGAEIAARDERIRMLSEEPQPAAARTFPELVEGPADALPFDRLREREVYPPMPPSPAP